jgi:hypothetical protein
MTTACLRGILYSARGLIYNFLNDVKILLVAMTIFLTVEVLSYQMINGKLLSNYKFQRHL